MKKVWARKDIVVAEGKDTHKKSKQLTKKLEIQYKQKRLSDIPAEG